jgi:site-specific DNA-methyltransferase (cytosine-N4-specific)
MSSRDLLVPVSSHRQFVPLPVTVNIIIGECLSALRNMAANTVDCCVTSPPYYFCRDYGDDRQIGLEASPVAFVEQLTDVFREVRRVLKPSGSLWLNIADNYCTRRAIRVDGKRTVAKGGEMPSWAESSRNGRTISGAQFRDLKIKEKDLFLVPHDIAHALRSDGWYIRGIFHWIKTAVVPEKERDAPSDAVEYVFLCTKADTGYVYNKDILREQGSNGEGRPHRNVWEIGPSSFRSAHTATMPEELAARCILTGSHQGGLVLDPFGGAGTTAAVAAEYGRHCDLIELNSEYGQISVSRVRSSNIMAACNIIQPASP